MNLYQDGESIPEGFREQGAIIAEQFERELSESSEALEKAMFARDREEFFVLFEAVHQRDQEALFEAFALGSIGTHTDTYLQELSKRPPVEIIAELNERSHSVAEAFARSWASQERQLEHLGFPSRIDDLTARSLAGRQPTLAIEDEDKPRSLLSRIGGAIKERFRRSR